MKPEEEAQTPKQFKMPCLPKAIKEIMEEREERRKFVEEIIRKREERKKRRVSL